jgi:hypothetical protein
MNRHVMVTSMSPIRTLHASAPRRAAEDPASFIANLKNTQLFRQLADKPDALAAISKLVKLMQEKGEYLSSRPPVRPHDCLTNVAPQVWTCSHVHHHQL